jgi:hypothetical protein
MEKQVDKVRFSNHAKERFAERFPRKVQEHDGNKVLAMCDAYYNSEIDNSIKNDTMFMTHVYENHGYDDFTISVNQDMVFIVKDAVLTTVLPAESYIGQRVASHSSGFKKK